MPGTLKAKTAPGVFSPISTTGATGPQGPTGDTGADGADGAPGAPGSGVPAGGTTGQALTKNSNTDGDVEWSTIDTTFVGAQPADADLTTIAGLTATTNNVIQAVSSAWASRTPAQLKTSMSFVKADVGLGNVDNTTDAGKPVSTATQTALDAKGPIRRTVSAQTGTTFAPLLANENTLVTLSNAAAITVTLPSNATQAFVVGAEVDFLWLGAGQPSFAQGSGATIISSGASSSAPSLRAQGSAATAKKISTNGWLVAGDLA